MTKKKNNFDDDNFKMLLLHIGINRRSHFNGRLLKEGTGKKYYDKLSLTLHHKVPMYLIDLFNVARLRYKIIVS